MSERQPTALGKMLAQVTIVCLIVMILMMTIKTGVVLFT